MKKCLPIVVKNSTELGEVVARHKERFDLFEVWLDYLDDLASGEYLKPLSSDLVCLFRRKNLEPSKTSVEDQNNFIDANQSASITWDFDITIQEEQLAHFRSQKRESSLLCSFHNYQRTPALDELEDLERRMDEFSPDITKFACFCESKRDTLRLLEFQLSLQEKGKRSIVLGMGEEGIITRIFGEQFGNEYTFVSVSDDELLEPTAPGQLTYEDLGEFEKIVKRIRDGRK